MYTTALLSNDSNRAILLRSHHARRQPSKERNPQIKTLNRTASVPGSKSYRDALQRAFNNAKAQVFFNPDMRNFITLTYKDNITDPDKVLHDVKMLLKRTKRNSSVVPKYIWIMEYQKRGAIHVHMIANDCFPLTRNKNGYLSLKDWTHGYTSHLTIKDFDHNFRPHLYLFKYMRKSIRIGKSFVHTSRGLNNYQKTTNIPPFFTGSWNTVTHERTNTILPNGKMLHFYRNYLLYGTMNSQ